MVLSTESVGGIDEAGRGAILGPLVVGRSLGELEGSQAARRTGREGLKAPDARKAMRPLRRDHQLVRCSVVPPDPSRRDRPLRHIRAPPPEAELPRGHSHGPDRTLTRRRPGVHRRPRHERPALHDGAQGDAPSAPARGSWPSTRRTGTTWWSRPPRSWPRSSGTGPWSSSAVEHGEFGSGYPSDEETIAYLRRWMEREGAFPPFARRSWRTWDRILAATLVP